MHCGCMIIFLNSLTLCSVLFAVDTDSVRSIKSQGLISLYLVCAANDQQGREVLGRGRSLKRGVNLSLKMGVELEPDFDFRFGEIEVNG